MLEYIIITLVCLLVYYRSLNYQPVVDDIANRKRHLRPNCDKNYPFLWRIKRNLGGECPIRSIKLDRILTISIHTLVCLLIYKAFGSLAASLLFAVNVSNNQISLWMNGKRYGINAILCLLAYILAPLGAVFLLLTPFFQVSAVTFPLVLALKGHWYLLTIIPFILLIGHKFLINWAKRRANGIKVSVLKNWHWKKPILMAKTIAYYFIRGLIPFVPLMYIKFLMHYGCTDEDNNKAFKIDLLSIFGFLLFFSIPIFYIINPIVGFGLMWWLITILVCSNWITLTVPIGERYMYLPNIGLMLSLSILLNYINPFACLIVIGIYTGKLLVYMPMYKNMDAYLEHHTYYDPKCDCCWVFRINRVGKVDGARALAITDEALQHVPTAPRLWLHKATLVNFFGNKEIAMTCLNRAKECCKGELIRLLKPNVDLIESMIKEEK